MSDGTTTSLARSGLSLRVASCLLAGHELAGVRGGAVCASAAVATAYAGSRLRAGVAAGVGSRIAGGAAEDVLSYALVTVATA